MSEPAYPFDENDWRDLTPADKKALKIIPRYSAGDFEQQHRACWIPVPRE